MSFSAFGKVRQLLSATIRKKAVVLQLFLVLSVFFEAAGLGLVIPVVNELTGSKHEGSALSFVHRLVSTWFTGAGALMFLLALFVLFYIVKTVFLSFLIAWQTRFNQQLSEDISSRLLKSYLHRPYAFFLDQHSAILTKNIVSEVNSFVAYVQALLQLQTELSIVAGIMVTLLWLQPIGALLVFVFVGGASAVLVQLSRKRVSGWGRERQHWESARAKSLSQTLAGVRDIRLFGGEAYFEGQFSGYNHGYFTAQRKIQFLTQVQRYYLECLLIMSLVVLSLVFVMQGHQLTQILPTLSLFVFAALRVLPSANRIVNQFQNMRFSVPGVQLVYEHLTHESQISQPKSILKATPLTKSIRVENVSFTYPGASGPVLDRLNMEIRVGEVTGITGPSGVGKTTLANVLMGVYAPSEGRIWFDDNDYTSATRARAAVIGYIPQQVYLTDDTIGRNVAFGVPDQLIDRSRIESAIASAQLLSFVAGLPQGLDSQVGERGLKLSGGQQQRVAIARALYHGARVLIFDEGTNGVDSETEAAIIESIRNLKEDLTIVIIAHSEKSLSVCEVLYMVDQGIASKLHRGILSRGIAVG